jgi:hypothetical protein
MEDKRFLTWNWKWLQCLTKLSTNISHWTWPLSLLMLMEISSTMQVFTQYQNNWEREQTKLIHLDVEVTIPLRKMEEKTTRTWWTLRCRSTHLIWCWQATTTQLKLTSHHRLRTTWSSDCTERLENFKIRIMTLNMKRKSKGHCLILNWAFWIRYRQKQVDLRAEVQMAIILNDLIAWWTTQVHMLYCQFRI